MDEQTVGESQESIALRFLTTIFGGKPENSFVLIWRLPDRLSRWFTHLDEAAIYACSLVEQYDTYIGVGLHHRAQSPQQRGTAQDIVGIPGVWLDIDLFHSVHKQTALPPSLDAALIALRQVPLAPSICIHSGHGLQCWWLFREPLIFEDDTERAKIAALLARWTEWVRQLWQRFNWTIDSTHDLSRVLRIAGTKNRKQEPIIPVRLLWLHEERRYNISDFESLVEGITLEGTAEPVARDYGAFQVRPGALPPEMKFEALKQAEPRFAASVDRKRKDMPDGTDSAYCQSLANFAAAAEWSDEEIVDLLVWWRARHLITKTVGRSFFAVTLRTARDYAARVLAERQFGEEIDGMLEQIQLAPPMDTPSSSTTSNGDAANEEETTGGPGPPPPGAAPPPGGLVLLSARFGVPITRFVKFTSTPAVYKLETGRGEVILGGISGLTNQAAFRNHVAEATGVWIKTFKGPEWDKVVQLMLSLCEVVDTGEESRDGGLTRSWLHAYLRERGTIIVTDTQLPHALLGREPFEHGGQKYLFQGSFAQWLSLAQGEKQGQKTLGRFLREIGAEPYVWPLPRPGKAMTTRQTWRLPGEY